VRKIQGARADVQKLEADVQKDTKMKGQEDKKLKD